MPKCLHPPCPRQVTDTLYCDEHQYVPTWTTNISRESEPYAPSVGFPSQGLPTASRGAPTPLLVPIILGLAILLILAVAVIVILKLIF